MAVTTALQFSPHARASRPPPRRTATHRPCRCSPRASLPPGGDAPFTRRVFEAAGAWLVAHPAPQFLVNNPLKRWVTQRSAGAYDAAATRLELEALIASDGVVIFSATYCPFSYRAKAELNSLSIPYTAYEHNTLPNGKALVAELGNKTGRTSIPAIFIAGAFIGGCNDGNPGLRPLIAQGGLENALAACGPEWQQRRKQALADAAARGAA
jgi:glutaredoxin 3